jgi:uncharacterized membrane protein YcjF (UPF0283 family)
MDALQKRDDFSFDGILHRVVQHAIEGIGPFKGARELVDPLYRKGLHTQAVVDRVVRGQVTQATVQGAVSGVGGLVTAAFFVQARLVAAIAHAHGHDLDDPFVRDRIARLVGASGASAGAQKVARDVGERAARTVIPRVQARAAARVATRAATGRGGGVIATRVAGTSAGRAIPVVGAAVGGAIDLAITRRVAEKARREFGRPL